MSTGGQTGGTPESFKIGIKAGFSLKFKDLHAEHLKQGDRAIRRWAQKTRLIAKRSIRKRKTISSPGQPPRSHTGGLRNFLRYGKQAEASYLVGVTPGNRRSLVPRVLEQGGSVRVPERTDPASGDRLRPYVARIARRPYLIPARNLAAKNLPSYFQRFVPKRNLI